MKLRKLEIRKLENWRPRLRNLKSFVNVAFVFIPLTLAAIFSHGFHHPDEHFQILEFAKYRLGESPAADLPWEFQAKIRPAAQPILAMVFIKIFPFFGIESPIWQAAAMRFLTAILWGGLLILFARHFSKTDFSEKFSQKIPNRSAAEIFNLTAIFWFVPYCLVRFSSENWSALLLWSGVFLLLKNGKWQWLAAGFLLGFSFFFRFQIGFALLGIFGWIIFEKHFQNTDFQWFIFGGLLAAAAGFSADRWFYGEWICAPSRYFQINIFEGKAAEFGESGWWFYLPDFLIRAIPPVSFLIFAAAIWGARNFKNRIFLWVFVPFFLGHSLVGHKELRFLFPMILPFVFWAATGVFYFFEKYKSKLWWRVLWPISLTINFLALVFVLTQSAADALPYFKFLEKKCADGQQKIWAEKENPYRLVGVRANFYQPKNLEIHVFENVENLPTERLKTGDLVLTRQPTNFDFLKDKKLERQFSRLPDWLRKFNFGGWQERSKIWEIWEVK